MAQAHGFREALHTLTERSDFNWDKERENYIIRHLEKRDHGETKKQLAYEKKGGGGDGG